MITKEVRKQILKNLVMGASVDYIGPSHDLRACGPLTKLYDRSRYMKVCYGQLEYRIKYFNLTCSEINKAIEVYDRLTEDPNELPF